MKKAAVGAAHVSAQTEVQLRDVRLAGSRSRRRDQMALFGFFYVSEFQDGYQRGESYKNCGHVANGGPLLRPVRHVPSPCKPESETMAKPASGLRSWLW